MAKRTVRRPVEGLNLDEFSHADFIAKKNIDAMILEPEIKEPEVIEGYEMPYVNSEGKFFTLKVYPLIKGVK